MLLFENLVPVSRTDAILKRLLKLHPKLIDLKLDRELRLLERIGAPGMALRSFQMWTLTLLVGLSNSSAPMRSASSHEVSQRPRSLRSVPSRKCIVEVSWTRWPFQRTSPRGSYSIPSTMIERSSTRS